MRRAGKKVLVKRASKKAEMVKKRVHGSKLRDLYNEQLRTGRIEDPSALGLNSAPLLTAKSQTLRLQQPVTNLPASK